MAVGLAKRHAGLRPVHPRQRRLPHCCPSQSRHFLNRRRHASRFAGGREHPEFCFEYDLAESTVT
jgi:hypothetical protein